MKTTMFLAYYIMTMDIIEILGLNDTPNGGTFLRSAIGKLHQKRAYQKQRYYYYYNHKPHVRRQAPKIKEPMAENPKDLTMFSNKNTNINELLKRNMYPEQTTKMELATDIKAMLPTSISSTTESGVANIFTTISATTSSINENSFEFPFSDFSKLLPHLDLSNQISNPSLAEENHETKYNKPFMPMLSSEDNSDSTTILVPSTALKRLPNLNPSSVIYVIHPNDLPNHTQIVYSPSFNKIQAVVTSSEPASMPSSFVDQSLTTAIPQGSASQSMTSAVNLDDSLYHEPPTLNNDSNPTSSNDDKLIDEMLDAMKAYENQSESPKEENTISPVSIKSPWRKLSKDPLLLSLASFIGAAMIFMTAILFLPKVITSPPATKITNKNELKSDHSLLSLANLGVQTIKGDQCNERLACEVGRAMNSFQIGSYPVRIFEVILPESISETLAQVRKAFTSRQACNLIECKALSTSNYKATLKNIPEAKINTIKGKQRLKEISNKKKGKWNKK